MVEALEVRFLGNRDDHVAFGLLTDLADASQETLPEDEALERLAEQRINELNDKYGVAEAIPGARCAAARSSSSTGRGAGTRRSASGWATSASAGSWPT